MFGESYRVTAVTSTSFSITPALTEDLAYLSGVGLWVPSSSNIYRPYYITKSLSAGATDDLFLAGAPDTKNGMTFTFSGDSVVYTIIGGLPGRTGTVFTPALNTSYDRGHRVFVSKFSYDDNYRDPYGYLTEAASAGASSIKVTVGGSYSGEFSQQGVLFTVGDSPTIYTGSTPSGGFIPITPVLDASYAAGTNVDLLFDDTYKASFTKSSAYKTRYRGVLSQADPAFTVLLPYSIYPPRVIGDASSDVDCNGDTFPAGSLYVDIGTGSLEIDPGVPSVVVVPGTLPAGYDDRDGPGPWERSEWIGVLQDGIYTTWMLTDKDDTREYTWMPSMHHGTRIPRGLRSPGVFGNTNISLDIRWVQDSIVNVYYDKFVDGVTTKLVGYRSAKVYISSSSVGYLEYQWDEGTTSWISPVDGRSAPTVTLDPIDLDRDGVTIHTLTAPTLTKRTDAVAFETLFSAQSGQVADVSTAISTVIGDPDGDVLRIYDIYNGVTASTTITNAAVGVFTNWEIVPTGSENATDGDASLYQVSLAPRCDIPFPLRVALNPNNLIAPGGIVPP